MENYFCKIAGRDELLARWDYLIGIHPGSAAWVGYRGLALRNFDNGHAITYLGFLNGESICEATAYTHPDAFLGDIREPSGLLDGGMAYLAAFRTNREYEGLGYFGALYRFLEADLRARGYTELSLGVGLEDVCDMEIYFHLGFREYLKTLVERDGPKEEVILFYQKRLLTCRSN